jgi:pimeloyl-ACP methyl ester carboxylesterase
VITVDLRGYGRTGATEKQEYSIDLFVDDLEQLLTHLGIDSPILCGVSIGGMIIQSYLDRHPDKARGVVIGGPLQSMPPVDIAPSVKAFMSPLPAISGLVSTIGPAATSQSILSSIRATTGGSWLTVDSTVRSQAMGALNDVSPDEYRKIFRALYEFVPPNLSHVQTPTVVFYGDHEAAQGKQQGERLAGTVVNGSWPEIPNAGHLVNQDNPQAFNTGCLEFFANLNTAVQRTA